MTSTRVSWSPLSGLKGVQPPLPFGERTRDCSPGHAGKEGPQLARTGAYGGGPVHWPFDLKCGLFGTSPAIFLSIMWSHAMIVPTESSKMIHYGVR